jgi:pyruvate dehydrogenase phosphatase
VAVLADGHGGHEIAQFVVEQLPRRLLQIRGIESMSKLFLEFDSEIEHQLPTVAGSCAIAAIIDPNEITVLNIGDSRGLLIFPDPSSTSQPALDFDSLPPNCLWASDLHTADSEAEQERLRREHPEETDVVQCRQKIVEIDSEGTLLMSRWGACYVKGLLQPTRAFGDLYLKTNAELESPPYISALPSYRVYKREPGVVLVLATDGLWDYLSPSVVVGVVRHGREDGWTMGEIADELVRRAMKVAVESVDMTIEELGDIPPGPDKRIIHDDTTVLVIQT